MSNWSKVHRMYENKTKNQEIVISGRFPTNAQQLKPQTKFIGFMVLLK